jgi:hypothetical protein
LAEIAVSLYFHLDLQSENKKILDSVKTEIQGPHPALIREIPRPPKQIFVRESRGIRQLLQLYLKPNDFKEQQDLLYNNNSRLYAEYDPYQLLQFYTILAQEVNLYAPRA